jgi:predicted nucleotidyltransferase
MHSQQEILQFISNNRSVLRKKFHITRIGIFGSYARKEQTSQSDIDLIVDFENNTQDIFELKLQLKQYFKEQFKIDVDICRERCIKPRFRKRIENEAIFIH